MDVRIRAGKSQGAFWQMFGLSQPAASRLECARRGSPALLVLLRLYLAGRIGDADLAAIASGEAVPSRRNEVQLHGPGDS
ncbi:hypothetical protein [Pseudomonas sp. RIT-PI-S]|uniref:hypothetical protein n=1 Tax=Pseudomonas sp. RIT-PI-S TaxID=3035295 RepID=UPI0021D86E04|nr:hypothetical protein [Pseudomonas sp. RIT-PI-S]